MRVAILLKSPANIAEIQPISKPKHNYVIDTTELRHKRLTYSKASACPLITFCWTPVNFLCRILELASCGQQNAGFLKAVT